MVGGRREDGSVITKGVPTEIDTPEGDNGEVEPDDDGHPPHLVPPS